MVCYILDGVVRLLRALNAAIFMRNMYGDRQSGGGYRWASVDSAVCHNSGRRELQGLIVEVIYKYPDFFCKYMLISETFEKIAFAQFQMNL